MAVTVLLHIASSTVNDKYKGKISKMRQGWHTLSKSRQKRCTQKASFGNVYLNRMHFTCSYVGSVDHPVHTPISLMSSVADTKYFLVCLSIKVVHYSHLGRFPVAVPRKLSHRLNLEVRDKLNGVNCHGNIFETHD